MKRFTFILDTFILLLIFTIVGICAWHRSDLVSMFFIVETLSDGQAPCKICVQRSVLANDAWILTPFTLMVFFSYWGWNFFIVTLLRFFALCLIITYLLDIYIYQLMGHRLELHDIENLITINTIIDIIANFFIRSNDAALGTIALVACLGSVYWLLIPLLRNQKSKILRTISFAMIICTVALFSLGLGGEDNLFKKYSNNYIFNFLWGRERENYSSNFISKNKSSIQKYEAQTCYQDGLNKKKNIIFVIVESLSSYHSNFFSGINDWTPHLDKLAKENYSYKNFFANHFNSLPSRVALLSGEIPIYPPSGDITNHYRDTKYSLPRSLSKDGYHTAALIGSTLSFVDTDELLAALNFNYYEGEDYEGYDGLPRYSFESVSDEALYRRTLDYISTSPTPYFISVMTVSSHMPYNFPGAKKKTIETAIKYADSNLYQFYNELKKRNFFDNGILMITGDHRAFAPVSARERKILGNTAVAKIPLVVIGDNMRGSSHRYLQQADIPASVNYYTKSRYCMRQHEHIIFKEDLELNNTTCIYHVLGSSRVNINVYCNDGKNFGVIRLNGEKTKYAFGNLSNPKYHVNWVNANRMNAILRAKEYSRKMHLIRKQKLQNRLSEKSQSDD